MLATIKTTEVEAAINNLVVDIAFNLVRRYDCDGLLSDVCIIALIFLNQILWSFDGAIIILVEIISSKKTVVVKPDDVEVKDAPSEETEAPENN